MLKKMIVKIRDYFRYKSEFILSRNPVYQILILAVIAVSISFLTTFILLSSNVMPSNWQNFTKSKIIWQNLMRVMDQGTMVSDEGSWWFLFIMLATTLIGLILVSTLISIITQGLESRIEELKKGRSKVTEKNHIVILGWSTKIYSIIDELILGSILSKRNGKLCIAVLANKSKTEMEDSIYDNCSKSRKARIVCRSGNPIILEKLFKMSIHKAESVLILASENQNPDVFAFKIILAIIQLCRKADNLKLKNIIAEIFDSTYEKLLRTQLSTCSNNIRFLPLNTKKIVSQIIAQTSIQKGLSKIYYELLRFSKIDNEIYVDKASKFISETDQITFCDLMNNFNTACLIGYIKYNSGEIIINPLVNKKEMEYKISIEDELIFIAKQMNDIMISKKNDLNENYEIIPYQEVKLPEENTIIFGVNDKLHHIIREIENYVEKKSNTTIVSDFLEKEMEEYFDNYNLNTNDLKQDISFMMCDSKTVDENMLFSLQQKKYHNLILLNFFDLNSKMKPLTSELADMEIIDAKTIKSLLNIRSFFEINQQKKGSGFSIVSEMKFAHNKDLVPDAEFDEFIISDEIISLIIAQIVLNNYRGNVYLKTLFSSDGSEIYLKDHQYYVASEEKISFRKLVEIGKHKKEIIVGCVVNDKPYMNPNKDFLFRFSNGDKVISLALDYTFEIAK